jgi:sensor domain CHASE-containing protein
MLRFFRQIRQRLLTDNKFSKYLLYAVGEILLVVIGILIALQINNWNEERIKDNAVRSHLESLADAIEDDIRELTISMEFNEFRFHSWQ